MADPHLDYTLDQVAKNLIAIEDHIKSYPCPVCLNKHLLALEEYCEEGMPMSDEWKEKFDRIADWARDKRMTTGSWDMDSMMKDARRFREQFQKVSHSDFHSHVEPHCVGPQCLASCMSMVDETVRASNIAALSAVIVKEGVSILREMTTCGESNLMQGYASTIITADFLYTAGLISTRAYEAIFGLATIISSLSQAQGIVDLFTGGASAFQPQLKTKVVQTSTSPEGIKTESTTEATGKAAQGLAGLIAPLAEAAL